MVSLLDVYSSTNRRRLLLIAVVMIVVIAFADRVTTDYVALGFLYLFPIMLVGGVLSRWQIVTLGFVCGIIQELYGYLPGGLFPTVPAWSEISVAAPRFMFEAIGYSGTGLFVSELVRNRRVVLKSLVDVSRQESLRRDTENQLRALIESSPAAIVTIDSGGDVLVANEAAQRLFSPSDGSLIGGSIASYLPALYTAVRADGSQLFQTALQCNGRRGNGEVFLAGVWFSRYQTAGGQQLAGIVVDLSEEVRNREEMSFDHLLKSTRLLMSGMSHEIRNLCGAAMVIHRNLRRVSALEGNEDFQALGALISSLERISEMELHPVPESQGAATELPALLDEFRVLVEATCRESGIELRWEVESDLPLIWGDQYSLLQVLLNLFRNSERAMAEAEERVLRVVAAAEGDRVVVRFEDSGPGIRHPENLFRPFQQGAASSGLGLYLSRAILKSFGAEISCEPRARGCCFVIKLRQAVSERAANS